MPTCPLSQSGAMPGLSSRDGMNEMQSRGFKEAVMQIATIGGSELGTGIPRTNTGLPEERVFEVETRSVYTKERAELIERCERLRVANSRLLTLQKEFEDDLAVAARVQRHLEPRPTVWGRVRVDTFSRPARAIGGDFGVVCSSNGEHLDLLLCDVAGHGISAALAASRIFSETNAHLQTAAPLGELLSSLNRFAIHN